ncbi:MAG: phage baseplate assembly protein V [Acidimicrobiales bacterium]
MFPVGPMDHERHAGRYYGKYSGTVADDGDPQKLGRLKVHVPSVWRGEEPMWARPCFPPCHFFTPPIGAAVWVEFEAGDPNYPLWVGTWYPQGTVPEEAAKEPPTSRVIRTPSGHTIELADAEDEEKIVIRHHLDSFVSVDKKGSVVIGNQNGSVVYLNADQGELTVMSEHGHRVQMTSDGVAVNHNDGTFVDLRADQLTLRAAAKVQVIANEVSVTGGAVSLGSGPVQAGVVVGSPALNLFLTHTHPSAMGPTGPPVPPVVPLTVVSQSVKASL